MVSSGCRFRHGKCSNVEALHHGQLESTVTGLLPNNWKGFIGPDNPMYVGWYFDGIIDEVSLWKWIALTSEEILARYNAVVAKTVELTGDYDDSGGVGAAGLNLVLFNWNTVGAELPNQWINERPGTGTAVGATELNGVLFNWGSSAAVATVPEPATGMLAVLGLLALGINRRRGSGHTYLDLTE